MRHRIDYAASQLTSASDSDAELDFSDDYLGMTNKESR